MSRYELLPPNLSPRLIFHLRDFDHKRILRRKVFLR